MRRARVNSWQSGTYSRIAVAFALFVAISAQVGTAQTANRQLPKPTGSWAVGRDFYFWQDNAREEPNTPDASDRREVRVGVWYPADPTAKAESPEYFPDLSVLGKSIGPDAMLLRPIKGHALVDPPIASGAERFPVVVLSPGLGTNGSEYAFLIEELASHGYLVAAVDHPFQCKGIAYPDGRVVTARETQRDGDPEIAEKSYRADIELRAGDLHFVFDCLKRLDAGEYGGRLAGKLNLAHVAAVGHSIGGITAAEACQMDERFAAAVNLDGHTKSLPFLPNREGLGPRQPLLELTDGWHPATDRDPARWKVTREQFDRQQSEMIARVNAAMRSVAGGICRVTIPGVRHGSFSDRAIWDPDPLKVRYRRMQIIRDYVRAFCDKYVRQQTDTLLDAGGSPYAEVTVERFQTIEGN